MKHLPRIAEALHTGAWAILPEVHDHGVGQNRRGRTGIAQVVYQEVHSIRCEQFRLHCLAGGAAPPRRPPPAPADPDRRGTAR